MATTIRLKKSGATGNVPSNTELDFGELALNYADGVLYYKNDTGTVSQISGSSANTFETINANGTLLIPDSNADILSVESGQGIHITANSLSDTLSIGVRFNDTVTSSSVDTAATANSVKIAYDQASLAYAKANAPITVKEIYASNAAIVNTFANISTIQFDADSGMAVVDEGNNAVTIQLNSTFKTWNINGGPGLVAFGLDTVNFLSANGISLSANNLSSPKTFTIDVPELPNAYDKANSAYAEATSALAEALDAGSTVQVLKNNSTVGSKSNLNFNDTATINVSATSVTGKVNLEFSVNTTGSGIVTAQETAQNAYSQANAAYAQANLAYTAANNSNLLSGGLVTGTINVTQDLIVGGNIYLGGNTTFINVSTYSIEDSLLYLASNNNLTDSVDIGLVGAKNTSGTFAHTGFARDATDGKWKLFDGLPDSGHVANVIDFANTSLATLVANVEANTLTVVNGVIGNVNFDSGTLFVDSVNDKVGIGTSSPGVRLDVETSASSAIVARFKNTSASGYSGMHFLNDSGTATAHVGWGNGSVASPLTNAAYFGSIASAPVVFTSADTERVRITIGGLVGIGTTNPTEKLDVNGSTKVNGSIHLTNTASADIVSTTRTATYVAATASSEVTIDSFASATYRSAKYLVQMTISGGYHVLELNLLHDNSTVFITQYGELKTNGSLGTFDADINSGNVRLLFTPTNNNTTVKLHRVVIAV